MDADVAAKLDEVLTKMAALHEHIERGLALVLKPKPAAKALSLSLSALKLEIRAGRITPCPLGKRWGVSRAELERYSQRRLDSMGRVTSPPAARRTRRAASTSNTGKAGAALVREALRARAKD